jgi:hypothetical protein
MTQPFNDFLCTLTASVTSSVIVYPIDVLKTRYQLNNNKSLINHIRELNIYKGLSYHLLTYPTFWSIYLPIRELNIINTNHKVVDSVSNSILPSVVACLISNPFFVLKTRNQSGHCNNTVLSIIKNEGYKSLLKGYVTTLTSNVKLGIQLPMYDFFNKKLDSTVYASILSKVITSSVFYPFEYMRVLQRNTSSSHSMYSILYNTPIRQLYRGVCLYTLMTTPNFVMMMYIYNKLKSMY